MKKLIFTLLILMIGMQLAWSQCNTAISERRFSEALNTIKRMPTGKEKTRYSMQFVKRHCLNSAQLVDVCLEFRSEKRRYKIASASYINIIDKHNFYDVYDLFTKFSTAMRLHDEVLGIQPVVVDVIDPIVRPDYSGLHFPDYHTYNGPVSTHCRMPIADRDFRAMVSNVDFTRDDNANLAIIKNLTQRNCLATAHIMKLCAYLENERNRLAYLKFAGDKVFDIGNFFETRQLLSHSFYLNDLSHYIQHNIDPLLIPPVVEEPCFVPEDEYRTLKKAIKDQTFSSEMMKSAKHYVQTRCFSMAQIGGISKVFSMDSDKLAYFKFAYDYAPDPENYLMFKSYLTFNSSKNELADFIIDKERGR